PRTYLVRVEGMVSEDDLERLRSGVVLDDGKTLLAQVQVVRCAEQSCWLRMTLREGRPRQIHRMLQRCGGHSVKRLQRLAMGAWIRAGFPPGAASVLVPFEVARMYQACHLETLAS